MVRNVAPVMSDLEAADFYLLSGIEHGMRFGEWVNRKKLPSFSGLEAEEVDYRLDRCQRMELIERRTIQYEGYRLLFEGYDVLALHTFGERGVITGVGAPLGEGKESDVLEVTNDQPRALKFHREGLTDFRRVDRERAYTADREHVSELYTARKAAEQEFEVLEALDGTVRVPSPIDHNRHAILMERVAGAELSRARMAPDVVVSLLDEILQEVARTYRSGYIHTDLSEYNILVTSEAFWLIDWPQAIPTDHPNSNELLRRDIENVIAFFERKHPSVFSESPDIELIAERIKDGTVDRIIRKRYA